MLAGELSGRPEEAFEGLSMAVTAIILSYVILWMRRQGRHMARDLESKLHAALQVGSFGALAGLAFFAVFREGAETVLYLLAGRESTGTAPRGRGLGLLLVLGLGC
jgi:high-affinity iron transporter